MSITVPDPAAKDASSKLKKLLKSSDSLAIGKLAREIKSHPRKSEFSRHLATLSRVDDQVLARRALDIMMDIFIDRPETANALVSMLTKANCWSEFSALLHKRKRLQTSQADFLRDVLDIMRPHEGSQSITLPLTKSEREREAETTLSLSSLLSRFRKKFEASKNEEALDLAQIQAFKRTIQDLERELNGERSTGKSSSTTGRWKGIRTRQERIDGLMNGEELTEDLFRMMTAREGFKNLELLLIKRHNALRRFTGRFDIRCNLSDAELRRLWKLMDDEIRVKLGLQLVRKFRSRLSWDTLRQVAEGPYEATKLALSIISEGTHGNKDYSNDQEFAKFLLKNWEELSDEIWSVFGPALELPEDSLPLWEMKLAGEPARVFPRGDEIVVSTPNELRGVDIGTGKVLWCHQGSHVPEVVYHLKRELFLTKNGPSSLAVTRIDSEGARDELVFEGVRFELLDCHNLMLGDNYIRFTQFVSRHQGPREELPSCMQDDGTYYKHILDFSEAKLHSARSGDEHSLGFYKRFPDNQPELEFPISYPPLKGGPSFSSGSRGRPGFVICAANRTRVFAFPREASGTPAFCHQQSGSFRFGLDAFGNEVSLRCWRAD